MGNMGKVYGMCSKDSVEEKMNQEKDNTLNLEKIDQTPIGLAKSSEKVQNIWSRLKSIAKAKLLAKKLISNLEHAHQQSKSQDMSPDEFLSKISPKLIERMNILEEFKMTNEEKKMFFYAFPKPPCMMPDGSIYYGSFDIYGRRHGYGKAILPDGSLYLGLWVRDVINKRGRLLDKNGDYFEGMFSKGKANGKGQFIKENGVKYTGDFKDDLQEGDGEEIFPNGSKYVGQFISGAKSGVGTFTWADGSVYQGMFQSNAIHGKGVYKWADGKSYNGEWQNNQMHGFGVFRYGDGKKYEGYFKFDKKEGYGIYYWSKKKFYDGQWKEGKRHGLGTLTVGKKIKKGIWTEGVLTKDFLKNEVIYEIDEQKYVKENLKKSENFFTDYNRMMLKKKAHVIVSPKRTIEKFI